MSLTWTITRSSAKKRLRPTLAPGKSARMGHLGVVQLQVGSLVSKFKEERFQSGYDVLVESILSQMDRYFDNKITWEQLRQELVFLSEHHQAAIGIKAGPPPWPLRFTGARLNVPPIVRLMVESADGVRSYVVTGEA